MNWAVYGFHFLSFLVSHPVISAYTNISLKENSAFLQMTDSQSASRKFSLKQTKFFSFSAIGGASFKGELVSFLEGFADVRMKQSVFNILHVPLMQSW